MANWLAPVDAGAGEGVLLDSEVFSTSRADVTPVTDEVGEGIIKLGTVLPSMGKKLLRLAARDAGGVDGTSKPPDAEGGGSGILETGAGPSSCAGDNATIGVEFGIGPNEPVVENRTSI